MNDKALKKILDKEHNDIKAPVEIKNRVSKSIDHLLLFKSLVELYASIPAVVIQGLSQKNDRGRDNTLINKK